MTLDHLKAHFRRLYDSIHPALTAIQNSNWITISQVFQSMWTEFCQKTISVIRSGLTQTRRISNCDCNIRCMAVASIPLMLVIGLITVAVLNPFWDTDFQQKESITPQVIDELDGLLSFPRRLPGSEQVISVTLKPEDEGSHQVTLMNVKFTLNGFGGFNPKEGDLDVVWRGRGPFTSIEDAKEMIKKQRPQTFTARVGCGKLSETDMDAQFSLIYAPKAQ